MLKRSLLSLMLVGTLTVPAQGEAQLTSTYSVSGSSGAWFLDFAFTNLSPVAAMGNQHMLYFFGANVAGGAYDAGPTGYSQWASWNQSGINFNVNWLVDDRHANNDENFYLYGIGPGETMGGFQATSTASSIGDELDIFGFTWNGSQNPGYVGTATRVNVSVPEPGSMVLVASGLLGLVGIRRRREGTVVEA